MQATYNLGDFAGFLHALDAAGFQHAVIGGCAVGAYAHLQGDAVLSKDLDLFVSVHDINAVLSWVRQVGARVLKRPTPRALSVALVEWEGKHIDLLTEAPAMPRPELVADSAREFTLSEHALTVPIADPFHLLANKLSVARPRDLEHAALLRAFIDEEVVETFRVERRPRHRIRPGQRLMDVLETRLLPAELGPRLAPMADDPASRRFLVNHLADAAMARAIIEAAPAAQGEVLQHIFASREDQTGR